MAVADYVDLLRTQIGPPTPPPAIPPVVKRRGKTPKPLTDKAAAVLELLQALPPHRGMKGADILDALNKRKPPMNFDQSTLTARIIPELKPYGAKNRRGVGYYIDPTMRSNGAASTHS